MDAVIPDSRALLAMVNAAREATGDAARASQLEKQRARAQMTARERIARLCDPGSFQEIGALVRPGHGPDRDAPADGVVTGFGTIDGRPAAVLSQDFSVFGGSIGELGGAKTSRLAHLACTRGVPLVMLLDGGGHRIQGGQNSRHFAKAGPFFHDLARMSGWIPIVAGMMGAGFAGPTNYAGMADFVVMVRGQSTMGLAGPALVRAGTGEEVSAQELGGAAAQVDSNGLAHLGVDSEVEGLDAIRRYLSYLPGNARAAPPVVACDDPADRMAEELLDIVPANTRRAYDVRKVIELVADQGSFFEIRPTFARNIVVGFARLAGRPVGFVANQPQRLGGMLTSDACDKAAHFIAVCDAFGLPLVYFIDVPGFSIGPAAERTALGRRSAKLLHELGHATVPRVSVVLRKGYGLGYFAMCGGRSFDSDASFAWPTAEICAMSIEGSVDVAYRKEYERHPDPQRRRRELIDAMRADVNVLEAAGGFGVDDIIDPRRTRAWLIAVLAQAPARRDNHLPPKFRSITPI